MVCFIWCFQTDLQPYSVHFYCWGNSSVGIVICPRSPRRLGEDKIEKKKVFLSTSLVLNLLEPAAVYY